MRKHSPVARKKFAFCLISSKSRWVPKKRIVEESELAALAKEFRLKSGKRKADVAAELEVARPTIQLAEENPEQSLAKVRIRIIEKYSPYKVVGPVYLLQRK